MAKLLLTDLTNLQNETTAVSAVNSNNTAIETAIENTLSRDGTAPNSMSGNIDMNSNRILNLPAPVADQEPARKVDLDGLEASVELAALQSAVADAETAQAAAEAAQTGAETALTNAQTVYDTFDDRYLGSKSSDPTLDNDGNALLTGALYWNTALSALKVYDGAAWVSYNPTSGAPASADFLVKTADSGLSAERVVTDGAAAGTAVWDWTIAGQVSAKLYGSAADKFLYTTGVNAFAEGSITTAGRAILDDADASAQRTTLGLAIGTNVLAYSADVIYSSATKNITVGYTATSYSAGTKSSGTFTPDPTLGNMQHATNNGAHTLAPPGSTCTMVIDYTNGASAGALTTSGFTKVSGDTYATTNTYKFRLFISVGNAGSHLSIQAMQ